MISITEKLLTDAGGWKAMKEAKALHAAGRVISSAYNAPVLRGSVRDRGIEFRSGLVIKSSTDMENLCTCPEARRYGTICAHSLAVGLANIKKNHVPPPVVRPAATEKPAMKKAEMLPVFTAEEHADALPVRLHVIFPPGLATAFKKKLIPMMVEMEQAGRTSPLNAASMKNVYRVGGEDLLAIQALRDITGMALPGMCALQNDRFLSLLRALRGHPRITLGRKETVEVMREPMLPRLQVAIEDGGGLVLMAHMPEHGERMETADALWCYDNHRFQEIAPALPHAYRELLMRKIVIPSDATANFVANELSGLGTYFTLDVPPALNGSDKKALPKVHCFLEGTLNGLEVSVSYEYVPGALRNMAFENSVTERLARSGFRARGEVMQLQGQNQILTFLADELPELEMEWHVRTGPRFQHLSGQMDRVDMKVDVQSWGEDWFTLTVQATTANGRRLSSDEVQRLMQSSHGRLDGGRIALFNAKAAREWEEVLTDATSEQTSAGMYRLSKSQAGYVQNSIESLGLRTGAEWEKWKAQTQSYSSAPALALGALEHVLRSYQRDGVRWMLGLASNRLGGILADDMGLGKTLQTLTLLKQTGGLSLVVCPTSLVRNWKAECEKFTPEIKCLVLDGPQRSKLFESIPQSDLVITSYALLRRDEEELRKFRFQTIVLDEANHIKNPDTQSAQSAFRLRAECRFVLTGTPLENSVRDLWSIMHFVMPGYLGGLKEFKERYEKPLRSSNADPALRQRLSRRLQPFMLRRLKSEVAKDLPEKIQQVLYADLTPAQEQVYREVLEAGRKRITDRAGERIQMLATLTRLRQVCCDLRLLGDAASETASGKTDLFTELLQEAMDGGHRVLVFSQFVRMLTLMREALDAQGVDYCYLDGQTKNRHEEVARFQQAEGAPVFLISLKAGGVGLNLTAADTVIHFDPWWNPAVEDQATDRAHRIGQDKVVTAYKLITRGTVEERILSLQAKKRSMIDAVMGEDFGDGLSDADLREILFGESG